MPSLNLTIGDATEPFTPYAPIKAGKAVGKLASAIYAGDMTLGEALFSARLDWELDWDDADWVINCLRDEFAAVEAVGEGKVGDEQ